MPKTRVRLTRLEQAIKWLRFMTLNPQWLRNIEKPYRAPARETCKGSVITAEGEVVFWLRPDIPHGFSMARRTITLLRPPLQDNSALYVAHLMASECQLTDLGYEVGVCRADRFTFTLRPDKNALLFKTTTDIVAFLNLFEYNLHHGTPTPKKNG